MTNETLTDDILKRCPFCGGKAHIETRNGYRYETGVHAVCRRCFAETDEYKTKERASKAWNRRTK